ncbi:PTS lactose/cellobiose transporter subunit IIA [Spiroplasma endosymbiont of Crioceris asparagi]|uniref:PTS lactose/cellobiose transporter subunit IIA n=1 Tax=Spiroplasma endosymbiont of Crioceris asparagi TaxID=3066286 RepID=UPI0030D0A58E
MNWEEISFGIITASKSASTLAFEAIGEAKKNNIEKANEILKNAHSELDMARKFHQDVVAKEANNERVEYNVLYIHAEDQISNTETILLLANEIINLWETKK